MVCFGGIPAKNAQITPGGSSEHRVRPALAELALAVTAAVTGPHHRTAAADALGPQLRPRLDVAGPVPLSHGAAGPGSGAPG